MKFWKDLSFQEQMATFRDIGVHNVDARAKECFFATAKLVEDDERAVRMICRLPVNDFLINTPEEVADYCRELAVIEHRNAKLPEALIICRQRLNEMYGSGMASDIRFETVDEGGFLFSYKLWCKKHRQELCVPHGELDSVSVEGCDMNG